MKVPVALVDEYNQPMPQPSDQMIKRVKDTITELSAEDWKARDRAEAQLTGMGPIIIPTLKQLRDSQSNEAQQRIDSILKQLEKQLESKPTGTSGPTGSTTPVQGIQPIQIIDR
jgi:hypothetical protein